MSLSGRGFQGPFSKGYGAVIWSKSGMLLDPSIGQCCSACYKGFFGDGELSSPRRDLIVSLSPPQNY
jgi:hypothetical protein